MTWFGHDPTPGERDLAERRKEEDKLNAENRKRKEQMASGFRCVTEMPKRY